MALGAALSLLTRRIADWFVMTDELLYERLALTIARTHSPLPRVHGVIVSNVNQLYPLVIAPVYRHGAILHGFHEAHVLNAFVMSSASLPAYLLARRVTRSAWLPFFVALATVTVPWIALSSFLLTEVVAYPAFVWAMLGLHASISRPSIRNDLLAVVTIAISVLARTQFYALAAILPAAIVALALTERRLRATARAHVTLVAIYALGAVAALALTITGHGLLGAYSTTVHSNPLPWQIIESAPAHLAIVALAGGLLPFLIGGGWLVANLRQSESTDRLAFAWLAVVAVVALTIEVASFDLRFGGGLVRERYLFYVTPLLLVAAAAALSAAHRPKWSIAVPLVVLAVGFWQAPFATFEKLNIDTPASTLNDWLLSTMHGVDGARSFLVLAALVLALLAVEGAALFSRSVFAVVVCAVLLVALPAETGYAFNRLFAVNGTAGLPLTLDQSPVFGWVDREITTNSEAVIVPYPVIRGDFYSNIGYWWDLEFWNKSVDREAARPNEFSATPPGTFPKVDLRFDPETGKANFDVDSYVAQAVADARFHVKGRFLVTQRDVSIVFPDRPWRADWVSYGLYPDGWTRPDAAARIRVFADARQRGPVLRTLTLSLLAPENVPSRAVALRSNAGSWRADVGPNTVEQTVTVCVPRTGHADVTFRADGSTSIYGDQSTVDTLNTPRDAGVLVGKVSLADELSVTCPPSR